MGKISLYDRAVGDYKQGLHALSNASVDDVMCDLAGYHLQQSVEKLLKYQIELQGEQFPYTHSISMLLDEVKIDVPDWIINNRETFTKYEAMTRYSNTKVASAIDLKGWYQLLGEYIEQLKPQIVENCQCKPQI